MRADGHNPPDPSARDVGAVARIAPGCTSCREAPARARGDREGTGQPRGETPPQLLPAPIAAGALVTRGSAAGWRPVLAGPGWRRPGGAGGG